MRYYLSGRTRVYKRNATAAIGITFLWRDAVEASTGDMRLSKEAEMHPYRLLLGRYPLGDYLRVARADSPNSTNLDRRLLADEWRAAHDHFREVERSETGIADDPLIEQLPEPLQRLAQEVMGDPVFQTTFEIAPVAIQLVQLDKLVVFQKTINLSHIRRIQESLGDRPTAQDVFRHCFPLHSEQAPVRISRPSPNSFVFSSPSYDLRFLDCTLLAPEQLRGYEPRGIIAGAITVAMGFAVNCLYAVHCENRLILHNGCHRAYALREMGIRQVPCAIWEISRRAELSAIGDPEVVAHPELFLRSPRPPLLKDYFDPRLCKTIQTHIRERQIKVSFSLDKMDL